VTTETVSRYRFPGVDGAWWLGLRPLPLIVAAADVTATVLALYVGAPLPVGLLILMVGAAAVLIPVGDRASVEWAPVAVRTFVARLSGAHRWRATSALQPRRPVATVLRLPASFGHQRVVVADGVGILDDARAGTLVGVLGVAGTDRFGLCEPSEQARLLDGWGSALAALAADSRIARLQWMERAAPEDRDASAWMRERAASGDPGVAGYLELVKELTAQSTRHDVWLAIAVDGTAGVDAVPDTLADVTARLLAAQLVARPLDAVELPELLRRGIDGSGGGCGPTQSLGPVSTVESWEQVRTDDCWHRGYAVTGWPRLPLTAGWLEPLLLSAPPDVARTVSVHLQPVAAAEAMRRARSARSRARLDAVDRARLGLVDSARVNADAAEAAAAEEELVAGYRLHRVCGVVTVSAPSATALDEGCRAVRTAAHTARLELRPLHGQHALALRAALPLCRADGRDR